MKLRRLISIFFIMLISQQLYGQNKTIAVLDLKSIGLSTTEAAIISSRLRADLFKTQKFTVVEREKMNEILTEQGFQLSGCTSDECIVEAGKLLGVKQIVAGEIGKLGKLYTLTVRMVDVQTGKLVQIATHDCACAIEDVLLTSAANVAGQLAGSGVSANTQPVHTSEIKDQGQGSVFLANPDMRYAQSLLKRDKISDARTIVTRYLNSSTDSFREEAMAMHILWKFSSDPTEDFEKLKAYFPGSRYLALVENKIREDKKLAEARRKLKSDPRADAEKSALEQDFLSISQVLTGTKGKVLSYSGSDKLWIEFTVMDGVRLGYNCFFIRFLDNDTRFQIVARGKVEAINGKQALIGLQKPQAGLTGLDCVVY